VRDRSKSKWSLLFPRNFTKIDHHREVEILKENFENFEAFCIFQMCADVFLDGIHVKYNASGCYGYTFKRFLLPRRNFTKIDDYWGNIIFKCGNSKIIEALETVICARGCLSALRVARAKTRLTVYRTLYIIARNIYDWIDDS